MNEKEGKRWGERKRERNNLKKMETGKNKKRDRII